MSVPLVSVVIPVRNEARTLRACLNSLFAQQHPAIEIIVINDGSTDETATILGSCVGRIQTLETGGVGPSRGRNLGASRARGEYVAFTDGDCVCDPDWIGELLRGFVQFPEVAGVGGAQLTAPDDPPYARQVSAFLQAAGFAGEYTKQVGVGPMVPTPHNPTCNVMYRRSIFAQIDGFVEWLWPGEDVEFDLRLRRAGFRLLCNPAAVVYHHRPDTPEKFRRMMFRYGEAQGILVRMYGPFRLIQLLPVMLAAVGAAGMIAPPLGVGAAGLAAGTVLALLRRRTPDTPTALACARMLPSVIWHWHRGFLQGIRRGAGPPAAK